MVQQGKKEIEGIRKYIEVDLDKYRSSPSRIDLHRAPAAAEKRRYLAGHAG